LYCKFATDARLDEGEFLSATGNMVSFLILREWSRRIILAIKEGKSLIPQKFV
jgi:hypothetical protein